MDTERMMPWNPQNTAALEAALQTIPFYESVDVPRNFIEGCVTHAIVTYINALDAAHPLQKE